VLGFERFFYLWVGYRQRGTVSTSCRIANTQQSSLIDQSRLYYISHMSPLLRGDCPCTLACPYIN